jgi:methionine-gamma-lyase
MTIVPDTKDWSWVLVRSCPECGFDPQEVNRRNVIHLLRKNAEAWATVLGARRGTKLRARPSEDRWSTLEYVCHVRDFFEVVDRRIARMLAEDDPVFENWDQDAVAIAGRYNEVDVAAAAGQLSVAITALGDRLSAISSEQWARSGTRSDGARLSVEDFATYVLHDTTHHLHDVGSNCSSEGHGTTVLHADRGVYEGHSVVPPIFQTVTFWAEDAKSFARIASERRGRSFYTRYGNPNHHHVARVVAELEHAESALVTASGMSTLTTAVLALVETGDHVIGQTATYAVTGSLLQETLPRMGVTTTQVDQTRIDLFEAAMTSRTKLVVLESPSNPLLQVTDLRAISDLAHARGALVIADNTFATPINQRPLDLGVDLVWHSATKYLNGHSDVTAGVIAGPTELLDCIWETSIVTGPALSPFDAWLLLRGLRTLPLRMMQHNRNGQALAEAFRDHPAVAQVHYPGITTDPSHEVARRQMTGFGGVVALEFAGGFASADTFLGRLRYARRAASLGGVESLAVHPAAMWSGTRSDEQIASAGVSPGLVRLAAGIEDTADLVDDVQRALDGV